MSQRVVEIMDTTLRDGEQTLGVSFSSQEKLHIAKILITELNVDRIEIASARVSQGEREGVIRTTGWAARNGHIDKIEVLGFVDNGISLNWIKEAGARVINMLAKGSLKHCKYQLRKSPEEHFEDIKRNIAMATEMGIKVNIYLEDWSNGMIASRDYVFSMIEALKGEAIERFMLPDTLGILNPDNAYEFCSIIRDRYPDLHFDFHAHNDYDLAAANTQAAVKAGINGVHTTINGLGERAGNVPLASVVAVLHDQLGITTAIKEPALNHASHVVESYSGIRLSPNKPIVGENVFTQCAGIHADGDNKNNLYFNDLLPERFGRTRQYALGKTSGKANIKKNLENLGIELDDDAMRKVTERIIELGDKKELVTPDDLPYIISDVLNQESSEGEVKILNYSLMLSKGLKPVVILKLEIDGKVYEESAVAYGQYDAFVTALRSIYRKLDITFPRLTDYNVSIPPGGKTDAFVQTIITWDYNGEIFKTRGLDADQTEAAIKATLKMLNKINQK